MIIYNNVPLYIINLFKYWYIIQKMYIKWGDHDSDISYITMMTVNVEFFHYCYLILILIY